MDIGDRRDRVHRQASRHVPVEARRAVPALVRSQEKGRELGCDFTVGDFDDPGSIIRALRDVDRLFLNAGGAVPADGEQPMIRQQEAAIDAAVAAGVSQVVKVSVLGARAGGRLATGAHWQIEEHLRASGLASSVLRPSGFMQNFLTGAGALTIDGKLVDGYGGGAVAYIDCFDIAACAAALLTGPGRPAEDFALTVTTSAVRDLTGRAPRTFRPVHQRKRGGPGCRLGRTPAWTLRRC